MRYLLLSAILFSILPAGNAQNITFCSDYSDDGKAIGSSSVWTITPSGGYVTALFHNGKKSIGAPNVSYKVEKEDENGRFIEVEHKNVIIGGSGNFAALEYRFLSPGNYRFKVVDGSNILATEKVIIRLNPDAVTGTGETDTYYYSGSSVSSGYNLNAETGKYENKTSSFVVDPKAGGYITFRLNTGKAINSEKITVEAFILKEIGSEHSQTKEFTMPDRNRTWTSFNLTFFEPGKYQVKIFNGEGVWICDGFVTIKSK